MKRSSGICGGFALPGTYEQTAAERRCLFLALQEIAVTVESFKQKFMHYILMVKRQIDMRFERKRKTVYNFLKNLLQSKEIYDTIPPQNKS